MAYVPLTPATHRTLQDLAGAMRAIVQDLRDHPHRDVTERLRSIADDVEWFDDAYRMREALRTSS